MNHAQKTKNKYTTKPICFNKYHIILVILFGIHQIEQIICF